MADRQGLELHKARRIDKRALDYGKYALVWPGRRGRRFELTLDDVERLLTGEEENR